MTCHHPIRVVKIGGSLFQFPALVQNLRSWLASQPRALNVLLAGGGRFADAVRDLDQRCEHVADQQSGAVRWRVRKMGKVGLIGRQHLDTVAAEPPHDDLLADLVRR